MPITAIFTSGLISVLDITFLYDKLFNMLQELSSENINIINLRNKFHGAWYFHAFTDSFIYCFTHSLKSALENKK